MVLVSQLLPTEIGHWVLHIDVGSSRIAIFDFDKRELNIQVKPFPLSVAVI